jgi:hypothetical protein
VSNQSLSREEQFINADVLNILNGTLESVKDKQVVTIFNDVSDIATEKQNESSDTQSSISMEKSKNYIPKELLFSSQSEGSEVDMKAFQRDDKNNFTNANLYYNKSNEFVDKECIIENKVSEIPEKVFNNFSKNNFDHFSSENNRGKYNEDNDYYNKNIHLKHNYNNNKSNNRNNIDTYMINNKMQNFNLNYNQSEKLNLNNNAIAKNTIFNHIKGNNKYNNENFTPFPNKQQPIFSNNNTMGIQNVNNRFINQYQINIINNITNNNNTYAIPKNNINANHRNNNNSNINHNIYSSHHTHKK